MRNPPSPRIKAASPTLAGEFLTTEPPGKSTRLTVFVSHSQGVAPLPSVLNYFQWEVCFCSYLDSSVHDMPLFLGLLLSFFLYISGFKQIWLIYLGRVFLSLFVFGFYWLSCIYEFIISSNLKNFTAISSNFLPLLFSWTQVTCILVDLKLP